jgi:hypothetical protein
MWVLIGSGTLPTSPDQLFGATSSNDDALTEADYADLLS